MHEASPQLPAAGRAARALPPPTERRSVRLAGLLLALTLAACGGGGGGSNADGGGDTGLGDMPAAGETQPGGDADAARDASVDNGTPACASDADCLALVADPCRSAVCDLEFGRCLFANLPDGEACRPDLSDPCLAGACAAGVCVADPNVAVCDDGNPCTADTCRRDSGCTYAVIEGPCDDGLACTTGDTCTADGCTGTPLPCDDGNACTADACVEPAGCSHVPVRGPCDDGDRCTVDDVCADGGCVAGPARPCDDGNPCTDDACHPAQGCTARPNMAACDDGNPCTAGDACAVGRCAPGADYVCPACTAAADCAPHDDGNPCNGTLTCAAGRCLVLQASIVVCPPAETGGCARSACNPANGQCLVTVTADGTPCWDGDGCTVDDVCQTGECVGESAGCDDGNPCTVDRCEAGSGCAFALADDLPCDDGDPCTGFDRCLAGQCRPGPLPLCAPCTDDAACGLIDDPDLCNGRLSCEDGLCALTAESIVVCDTTGDTPCRTTACDPATGRCSTSEAADGTPCSSGDPCRYSESCLGGECFAAVLNCDDGNPCTNDGCGPGQTCVNTPNFEPCDDGNPCTVADVCSAGECQPGGPAPCDDGNPCTADVCHPSFGCTYGYVSGPCDDALPCTDNDTCVEGDCFGTPKDCDDGNPCTDDLCAAGTCEHVPNTAPCEDGDACTIGDTCAAGTCQPGVAPDCDDQNPCTADQCSAPFGCGHTPVEGACDDGNTCTHDDVCTAGLCGGVGPDCDDGDPCTADGCDAAGQCTHEAAACCGDETVAGTTVHEDFEAPDFPLSAPAWQLDGWLIDSERAFSGLASLVSTTGLPDTPATATLRLGPGIARICFRLRGSSESDRDVFRFRVDDEPRATASGSALQYAWQLVCADVAADVGHRYVFEYVKDSARDAFDDRFWIDALALDAVEMCDDGNRTAGDGCSADCLSDESCGNGQLDAAAAELCDDGNVTPGDGCDAECVTEPGFDCPLPGRPCGADCGDGVTAGTEQCDDGQNGDPCDGCLDDCTLHTNRCGDGNACAPEACDDGGNGNPCDGCLDDCSEFPGTCGDEIVCGREMCDDGNTEPLDGCSADCRSDERCGNGFIDGAAIVETFDHGGAWGPRGWTTSGFVLHCTGGDCRAGTPHDYGDDIALSLQVSVPAGIAEVCYDIADFDTESCCDPFVFTVDGTERSQRAGSLGDFTECFAVDPAVGHTYRWSFSTDSSVTGYGFDIVEVRFAGALQEACDDGNTRSGDGCAANCALEPGFACPQPGAPCTIPCGDGIVLGSEICDDGNAQPGDGCRADCHPELGWTCPPAGGRCTPVCGDGRTVGNEPCDDGQNGDPCDGCLDTCAQHENVCGDGFQCDAEVCDDGNVIPGDGCAGDCSRLEECGNGLLDGANYTETFDHGGGWGPAGWVTSGFTLACNGGDCHAATPHPYGNSVNHSLTVTRPAGISEVCYDVANFATESCCDSLYFEVDGSQRSQRAGSLGNFTECFAVDPALGHSYRWRLQTDSSVTAYGYDLVQVRWRGGRDEACDDGNTDPGDGCDAECAIEYGYACPEPNAPCIVPCGDGLAAGAEGCDDGNTAPGDGCDAACQPEAGFDCPPLGGPCAPNCGDGVEVAGEACDDGQNGDPCDGCLDDCTVHVNACGDGFLCDAEICDDGNVWPADGCSADCLSDESCGNGIVDPKAITEDFDHGGTFGSLGWASTGFVIQCSGADCVAGTPHPYANGVDLGLQIALPAGFEEVCLSLRDFASEGCCDHLYLLVDGATLGQWQGTLGTFEACVAVTPGAEHTYRLRFTSDSSITGYGFDLTAVRFDSGKGETCDDGNPFGGDGCDAGCRVEPGYSCPEPGSPCIPE